MVDEQLPQNQSDDITGIEPDRLMAAMSYMWILVLVPLLTERDNAFVLFHAKQGLVIFAATVISLILAAWSGALGSFLVLIFLLVSIAGILQALQGKWWRIPVVANIADKFSV